jgi:membrane-associated protease RseP (regulator of RpoE activity)
MRTALFPALLMTALLLSAVPAAWADEDEAPFLGIYPGEVTSDIAADYGVKAGEGILVQDVVPGTPADKAGFRENDVITRVNDAVITGPAELRTQLKKHKPGDTVNITYLRGGQTKTVAVKLGRQGEGPEMSGERDLGRKLFMQGYPWQWRTERGGKKVAFAGVVTQSLSEGLAKYFKVEKGALISEVDSDSPAEKAGLKAGDVIVKIGSEDIEDEGDVAEAIRAKQPGDTVDFVIYRDGQKMTIKVTLGETSRWGSLEPGMIQISPGHDLRMYLPRQEDLDKLAKQLDKLEIQVRAPQVPSHSAVTISTSDYWQQSFDRLRDSLEQTFQRLRAQIDVLRMQLHDLAQRLHLATA